VVRLVYVLFPLWIPFYFVWQREWVMATLAVAYSLPLFLAGIVIHGTCVVWNFWERVK
jgi:hypothetical protein